MIHSTDMSGLAEGFVHKRLLSAGRAFLTTGSPLAAAAAGLAPTNGGGGSSRAGRLARLSAQRSTARRISQAEVFTTRTPSLPAIVRRPVSRTLTARPSATSARERAAGASLKFAGVTLPDRIPCIWPLTKAPDGSCMLGTRPGPDVGVRENFEVGGAVMGRYGAALTPGSQIVDRAVCLPGMVLGNDDLCYNKSQIKNSERMWPRGRRPLLTGGEMRAISVATRAAGRLTRTAVRLQDMGLIKKPVVRRPRKKKD